MANNPAIYQSTKAFQLLPTTVQELLRVQKSRKGNFKYFIKSSRKKDFLALMMLLGLEYKDSLWIVTPMTCEVNGLIATRNWCNVQYLGEYLAWREHEK